MFAATPHAYGQAAVVIPAHHEKADLPACLRAVLTACLCVPTPVTVVVVLDATEDGSTLLAGEYGPDVHFVRVEARDVGAARAAGFRYVRSLPTFGDADCWYATTDADSRVDPDWLVRQLKSDADMYLGLVRVTDRGRHRWEVVDRLERDYETRSDRDQDADHVQGANMGFSSAAYWRLGGFRSLSSGEDVDLVARFEAAGYRVDRDTRPSVVTSARIDAPALDGFADRLRQLDSVGAAGPVEDCA
ncbi:glycosyl transferase [Mycobacterium intermedium]|uniref:4,4'-diaponeurosporenoate glycosyltransferase n=1 Tax=Mycobacterium intermedium TaxID=28445 RepID=A0A1E3SJV5_MYCIE|nr:glycosyltransferase [Mycobacterium intermedium]MCV6965607.1 glycosyltransferase [Mycobacterium intermedium]ODR02434.1 glycosyl transferase [Mycobacterium intermedium]OPE51629.1 glycosyl transferase [Mycobacterium intermedium]ORB02264.1 glycosyl transferase [Mycobacterium intermedium]